MDFNAYKVLGISPKATTSQIKKAYRELVKKHHPDAGGNETKIIEINAAWEILKTPQGRLNHDQKWNHFNSIQHETQNLEKRNAQACAVASAAKDYSAAAENALSKWLQRVYIPIDRLLGEIINPFPKQIKALSADPYDDNLMGDFCTYLESSRNRLEKINHLYQSLQVPQNARGLGLNLYHCFSQVEDSVNEFERYTMGYVDEYLHDGKEMLKKAKQIRIQLKEECRQLNH